MDIRDLSFFAVLAQQKSFNAAAKILKITQPGLTYAIKRLEDEIGEDIVDHTKNKLILTNVGEILLDYANEIIQQQNTCLKEIKEFINKEMVFEVCSCDPGPRWYLTKNFPIFYPHLDLKTTLFYEDIQTSIRRLRSGRYSLLITSELVNEPDLECIKFAKDRLLLSVHKDDHRFDSDKSISFYDPRIDEIYYFDAYGVYLKQLNSIYRIFDHSSKYHKESDIFQFSSIIESRKALVMNTQIVVKYRGDNPNRKLLPVIDNGSDIDYYAVYKKTDTERLQPLLKIVDRCSKEFI